MKCIGFSEMKLKFNNEAFLKWKESSIILCVLAGSELALLK